jgi:hypothetical protein
MSRTRQARSTAGAHVRAGPAAPGTPVAARVQSEQAGPNQADEQRRGPRRQPRPDRALVAPFADNAGRNWVPRRWPYLILTMIAAVVSCMVATRSMPGPVTASLLTVAVAAASGVGFAHKWAATRQRPARLVAVAAVVVLPMFAFGMGLTRWTAVRDLPWDVAIAALLCVAGVAAAYLRRQPGVIFAAQISVWSAAVIAHASVAGGLTVLVALAVAILVSREQHLEQRYEEERRRARDRIQTRARDILADYEETRQGWFWETDRRALLTYITGATSMVSEPTRASSPICVRCFWYPS